MIHSEACLPYVVGTGDQNKFVASCMWENCSVWVTCKNTEGTHSHSQLVTLLTYIMLCTLLELQKNSASYLVSLGKQILGESPVLDPSNHPASSEGGLLCYGLFMLHHFVVRTGCLLKSIRLHCMLKNDATGGPSAFKSDAKGSRRSARDECGSEWLKSKHWPAGLWPHKLMHNTFRDASCHLSEQ